MTEESRLALSKLNSYLIGFGENGYSAEKAEEILSLIFASEDTPFGRIISSFGCEAFDAAALALSLLVSVSGRASSAAAELCGAARGFITPAIVSAMFFGTEDILPFEDRLCSYSPLSRLIDGVTPAHNASMRIKPFAAEFLTTGNIYDDYFILDEKAPSQLVELNSQEKAVNELINIITGSDVSRPFIIRVLGDKGSGRKTCVKRAFSSIRRSCMQLKLTERTSRDDITELSSKLILAESIPIVIPEKNSASLYEKAAALSDETGMVIVICERSDEEPIFVADTVTVEISTPDLEEQYLLWKTESSDYKLADGTDLSEISGEFEMTPGAVKKALRYASMLSGSRILTDRDIKKGCYRSFNSDMGSKAVRLKNVFTWDDIVIPEQTRNLLSDACHQVRLRHKVLKGWGFSEKMPYGTGVSMIFTGPPGTGKTMGAQVMASELGMDIYKISLANVVSKYIGETEKNLNEIFAKARLCKCILFFDEADVLFSKRTEVKEANDKYSNMESAFLLQKTEEYSGVVILATNLVQNFDEAFKRRMRFIIDFPFPDPALRRQMWQKAFPGGAPLEDIDFDYLVERFEFSGSNIRNIALHSAFLAAADNSSGIGMKHIVAAVRNEYAKSGKAFTKAEAGEYYYEL